MDVTEVLDIKGEVCPNTFVYTKIKLEDLAYAGGGILKVIIDHAPACENIPRSIKGEKIDYELLEIKQIDNIYELYIRAPNAEE